MNRYDPLEAPDPVEWLSLDEQERIDLVQDFHRRARISVPNEPLHAVVHAIVENQIALGDELPVRRALDRLVGDGLDRHDAIHAIGSVLAQFLNEVLRDTESNAAPMQEYCAAVERLTADEWLKSVDDSTTDEDTEATGILDELARGTERLPVEAIRAAGLRRADMVPMFLELIDSYLAESSKLQVKQALFFIFHLLGEWREKSAYPALARLLRLPREDIEHIFGDATTETSHRVMAAVFDGDPQPLYDVILDPEADEYIRSRMCETLAMLTLREELPRAEVARFLRTAFSEIEPNDDCFVWMGWQSAIAILGLVELEPLVRQAFQRGSISPSDMSFEDFEEDLQSVLAGSKPKLWDADEYSLFGDTIEELSTWAAFSPDREKGRARSSSDRDTLWSPSVPAVNPFKDVGRNDPCPCGSGKKFKKCCLN